MRGRRWLVVAAISIVGLELVLRLSGALYVRWTYGGGADADPNAITILCLGESSTVGLWVPREDSYPGQLEHALRDYYGEQRIHVVVPLHLGQNTSQIADHLPEHLRIHRPRLVVLMTGYNNEWSLAES